MRIAYLHQYFVTPEQGGGTRSYEFARRWVKSGHAVHVLRIGSPESPGHRGWTVTEVDGITVHTLGLAYSNKMSVPRRLAAFGGYATAASGRARNLQPDAIYATSTPLTVAIPALVASVGHGAPYVFEVRDQWPDVPIAMGYLRNPALRWSAVYLESLAYRNATHIVALAPGMKEDIEKKGIQGQAISVIPQGCDVDIFRGVSDEAVRRENPWLGEGPVFLYAGAIGPANGLEYLIEVSVAMRHVLPLAQFVVLGDGKERLPIEALARAKGLLGHSVHFLGPKDKRQVAAWMAASDATVALLAGPRVLWKDAVQNKFFDSIAAERPIATNRDCWQAKVAVEAGIGVMLDPQDPEAGARKLADMVGDTEFMARVPQNCRELAASRFNRDVQAEQALQLLITAAEQSNRSSKRTVAARHGRAIRVKPIHLSQGHVTELEVEALRRAATSGWVAPLGPEVDGFEADICAFTGAVHALALSSGSSALHLALLGLGVQPGDSVIVPTLTFGATAFAVTYTGGKPVFLDVDERSWGLDPRVLETLLDARARTGRPIAAIVPVDLFGRPADYDRILPIAAEYGVPVLVDAAESLGATHGERAAGTMGHAGIYSFNGNKIMTTSGGGMLVSDDEQLVDKARFWSTQSRGPFPWYEHEEIGFNYRLSNILAALGRAQLVRLPEMIARRRQIRAMYTEMLAGLEGVVVTPDPPWGIGNSWLTTVTFDRALRPGAPTRVRESLQAQNIESRPIWKPMHQQPVFRDHEVHLSGVADRLFDEGLCLPTGVGLSDGDIERVAEGLRRSLGSPSVN